MIARLEVRQRHTISLYPKPCNRSSQRLTLSRPKTSLDVGLVQSRIPITLKRSGRHCRLPYSLVSSPLLASDYLLPSTDTSLQWHGFP